MKQAVEYMNLKELQEEPFRQYVKKIKADYWSGVKNIENSICGSVQMHNGKRVNSFWMVFFLNRERCIFTVIKDETSVLKGVSEKLQTADLQEGTAILFHALLEKGQYVMEEMENNLINLEREIVTGKIDRSRNQEIFECKRTLTLWKHDYMQLLNLAEGIKEMGEILNEADLCYFRVYENKVRRMTEQIQFLYEELLHVREALDAAISYEQNRIMKVFTTVTTIFMPLTLIAGWYGMNFNSMPELKWNYGYLFVIFLSLAVVGVCMMLFRKKKLL